MNKFILSVCLLFSFIIASKGSDITRIIPLHKGIVMIEFSDGHINYHGYHQTAEDDVIESDPLDIKAASFCENYTIQSSDDTRYRSELHPLRVGRKSKSNGGSMKCDEEMSIAGRCNSPHVLRHFIYLELPFPLEQGKSYTFSTGNLAKNENSYTFTFDEFQTPSAAVHVNLNGFTPESKRKFAYISHWMGDMGPMEIDNFGNPRFYVVNATDNKVVYSGYISKQKDFQSGNPDGKREDSPSGNFIAADVWEADFSELQTAGEYFVVVENFGRSGNFKIDADIYRTPFYYVTRGLYHHRSGIELKEPYTQWWRGACHNPKLTPGFRLRYSHYRYMDSKEENGPLDEVEALFDDHVDCSDMWGWYQDAGDWDGYTSHTVIPAFLMTTFEFKPKNFSDGELNIPESGNGIPDLLDEAQWLLNHYRRTKGPTGGNAGGRIEGDRYPANESGKGHPSYEDIRPFWIVYGEEPLLTFIYARLAAQYAYNLRLAKAEGVLGKKVKAEKEAEIWHQEALHAWKWANENLREGDSSLASIKAQRTNAAAWLYKLTGDSEYQKEFENGIAPVKNNVSLFEPYKWGIWGYVTVPDSQNGLNKLLQKELKEVTLKFAEHEVTDAIENGRSYRLGTAQDKVALQGHATTPLVMPAIVAYEVSGIQKFLDAVYTSCDYMLGGNPLDMVWITGMHKNSVKQAFNMDSWYRKDGKKEIVPGIIPYGPQSECDWMKAPNGDCNAWGWWDNDYSLTYCYPHYKAWPVHELWFEHRYAPPTAEYTVHQNIGPAAAVYGYLTTPLSK
ncbi:MAG: glycoside hydrolase family 9 protein [Bacteroidales bacterium]|nr:glycoside hydrolase family 9 protein [Bacteroidales bacterium]